MKSKRRETLTFILRLGIGLLLLIFLLRSVDTRELAGHISSIRPRWIVAAAAIVVGLRVLMSMRWQDVLALQGLHVDLWTLIRITFVSMFFGHFLPGGVGADVVRGYELISRKGKTAEVTATLILDRFIGVYSMFVQNWPYHISI